MLQTTTSPFTHTESYIPEGFPPLDVVSTEPKTEVKNGKLNLYMLLDSSGSMSARVNDVITKVNDLKNEQASLQTGSCFLSIYKFNQGFTQVRKRTNVKKQKDITRKDYYTMGMTALRDALAKVILIAREDEMTTKPEMVQIIVQTDGYENSSTDYSQEKLAKLVKKAKDEWGYHIIFVGADQDAFLASKKYGIDATYTMSYSNTKVGSDEMFKSLSSSVSDLRTMGNVKYKARGAFTQEDKKKQDDILNTKGFNHTLNSTIQ